MNGLYQSAEWRSLDKYQRSQFLLLIEGIKRGATIEGKPSFLKKIFEGEELEHWTRDERLVYTYFFVARPGILEEMKRKILTNPQKVRNLDFDRRLGGWFYGYPDCCIDVFAKTLANKKPEPKFYKELETIIRKGGKYPDIFDYRPVSFTPCKMECEEAVKFLKESKQALETLDPEAAQELVFKNRGCYPQNLIHEDYLRSEFEGRTLEGKLEFLRKSVGKYN